MNKQIAVLGLVVVTILTAAYFLYAVPAPPPPPPPNYGILDVQCLVNMQPTPPDSNKIVINGADFLTDSNGHWADTVEIGSYTVSANYNDEEKQTIETVTENVVTYAKLSWVSEPPPPQQGILDVSCYVDNVPTPPDGNQITINDRDFATDSIGHWSAEVGIGDYVISATYQAEPKSAYGTVESEQTTYVTLSWGTQPEQYTLTIAVSPVQTGTTQPSLGSHTYSAGQNVAVTAIPNVNYSFHYWLLDGNSFTDNPIVVTMTQDHNLEACFEEDAQPPPPPPGEAYTVATTGGYPCLNTPHERQVFYGVGLHWIAYEAQNEWGGDEIVYRTSVDGITWSESTKLYSDFSTFPDFFDWEFDGSAIHLAYLGYFGSFYRKGIPQSDGTITWLADWQRISELDGIFSCDPTMCIDSYGHPWIGFYYDTMFQYPCVIRSARNDGIWEMDEGFPYLLTTAGHRGVGMVALTNGKVYALYYRAFKEGNIDPPLRSDVVYGQLWDGMQWGLEEQVTTSHIEQHEFHQLSFVGVGDVVHFAFLRKDSGQIVYVQRTSTGWGQEVVLGTVTDQTWISSPQLSYSSTVNEVYCFWVDVGNVYARTCDVNDEAVLWIAEEPIGVYAYVRGSPVSCSEREVNGVIGMAWTISDRAYPSYGTSRLLRYAYMVVGSQQLGWYPVNIFGVEVDLSIIILGIAVAAGAVWVWRKKKHPSR